MNIAIIGRSELMYNTALLLLKNGHKIPLIITAKESPEHKKTRADFKELAEEINADFYSTGKIKSDQIISAINSVQNLHIAVSVNYSSVIPDEIINLFSIGVLNAHGGDLPRYRGNACQAWAMINRETKIGLCIHKMIGGEIDSGNIIARDFLDINIDTRINTVYKWMDTSTPNLFLGSINKLSDNPDYILEKQSKKPKDALRCYPRIPEDGKIDWTKSAEDILRLINASSEPYSGAFTFFNGERITIWNAILFNDDEVYSAIPGQIANIDKEKGNIIVITGNGKLLISSISKIDSIRQKPSQLINTIRKRFT